MQIVIHHAYRFGVEQMVMALLPLERIETTQELEPQRPYLLSQLEGNHATCTYYDGSRYFYGESGEKAGSNAPQDPQFWVKDALYQAVAPSLQVAPPWGSLSGVRPAKLCRKLLAKHQEATASVLEEVYHVHPIRSEIAYECALISQEIAQSQGENSISLYVGIPFCPTRCHYCSFYAYPLEEHALASYLQQLHQEIQQLAPLLREKDISSLYLGGGTPTVLSPTQLEALLSLLHQCFPQFQGELTVEAGRPDTISPEKLAVLAEQGVTRLSINPQSFQEATLARIGRGHSNQQVDQAYRWAEGTFQVNMDLIAGLVGESPQDFQDSLEKTLAYRPSHITVHSLTLKNNTPLQREQFPSAPQQQWEFALNQAWARLRQAGYAPYYLYRQKQITQGLENVGWHRIDSPISLYNVAMMEEIQTIVSFGAGSVTKLVEGTSIKRLQNPKYPQEYQDKLGEILLKKKAFLA